MGQLFSRGPETRSEIVLAIYVVGPSSSGKTTLCDALAARCDIRPPAYIKEVARTVMRDQGFTRDDVGSIEMQYAIMKTQVEADRAARAAVSSGKSTFLLSDRSAVDPIVYSFLSSTERGDRRAAILVESPHFQSCLERLRHSVFILLPRIPEWVEDDGVRTIDRKYATEEAFRDILGRLEISFYEMEMECRALDARVQRVLEIARLL